MTTEPMDETLSDLFGSFSPSMPTATRKHRVVTRLACGSAKTTRGGTFTFIGQ